MRWIDWRGVQPPMRRNEAATMRFWLLMEWCEPLIMVDASMEGGASRRGRIMGRLGLCPWRPIDCLGDLWTGLVFDEDLLSCICDLELIGGMGQQIMGVNKSSIVVDFDVAAAFTLRLLSFTALNDFFMRDLDVMLNPHSNLAWRY
ncbi:hypothetical protein Droror1_Dr00022424 [Drosera rotundifolia]